MTYAIALAESDADIARCYPVIRELRPHIANAAELVARVQRQRTGGYHLAYRAENEGRGRVVACGGWRINEHLAWGLALYVDDLVTLASERSQRHGDALFDWLVDQARQRGCVNFHLDSGTHRVDAHRFYLRKRMAITSFHFGLKP